MLPSTCVKVVLPCFTWYWVTATLSVAGGQVRLGSVRVDSGDERSFLREIGAVVSIVAKAVAGPPL